MLTLLSDCRFHYILFNIDEVCGFLIYCIICFLSLILAMSHADEAPLINVRLHAAICPVLLNFNDKYFQVMMRPSDEICHLYLAKHLDT
jgi:hypothetical protein